MLEKVEISNYSLVSIVRSKSDGESGSFSAIKSRRPENVRFIPFYMLQTQFCGLQQRETCRERLQDEITAEELSLMLQLLRYLTPESPR